MKYKTAWSVAVDCLQYPIGNATRCCWHLQRERGRDGGGGDTWTGELIERKFATITVSPLPILLAALECQNHFLVVRSELPFLPRWPYRHRHPNLAGSAETGKFHRFSLCSYHP